MCHLNVCWPTRVAATVLSALSSCIASEKSSGTGDCPMCPICQVSRRNPYRFGHSSNPSSLRAGAL
jgi:hypothetical protein